MYLPFCNTSPIVLETVYKPEAVPSHKEYLLCSFCKRPYLTKRRNHKYCSVLCKRKAKYERDKENAELEMQAQQLPVSQVTPKPASSLKITKIVGEVFLEPGDLIFLKANRNPVFSRPIPHRKKPTLITRGRKLSNHERSNFIRLISITEEERWKSYGRECSFYLPPDMF